MNTFHDNLLDSDLDEILSGRGAPDLTARALQKLAAGTQPPAAEPARADARPAVATPRWRAWARAAAVLLVLGMAGWLLTRPDTLPRGVTAAEGARWRVRADHVELKSGWVLLSDGAPVLVVGDGRVENVNGRTVAGTGIPGGDALDPLADHLDLSALEREAMKNPNRWITAGMLALCVLSGQAVLNGRVIAAEEDTPPPRAQDPKPEDTKSLRALLGQVEGIELRVAEKGLYSGWLTVRDAARVRAIAAAFATHLGEPSATPAGIDHTNQFELRLKDGRVIRASVFTRPGRAGLCDIRLPSWERYHQFDCAPDLAAELKAELAAARNQPRLPVQDAKAMRALLARAVEATFVDSTDQGAPLRGTIRDAAVLARMAGLLWPEDMGFSKTHLAERDVYQLALKLNDGSGLGFVVGDSGIFTLTMTGETSVEGRILPGTSMQALREMFTRAADTRGFAVLRQWTGENSRVTRAQTRLVYDDEGWTALWNEHAGTAAPAVNFEREIVLAVFGGDKLNSRGYTVREILQGEYRYTLRLEEEHFQTAGPDGGGVRCAPFAMFALPRTEAAIHMELNVQGIKRAAPLWQPLEAKWKPRSDINPMVSYTIDGTRFGSGGFPKTKRRFLVARDAAQWQELNNDINTGQDKLPAVDWDQYIAVAATEAAPANTDQFELVLAGMNQARVVLRLTTPGAQTESDSESPGYERIWRIWLIPKPDRDIVIETPRYDGTTAPTGWLETHTIRR